MAESVQSKLFTLKKKEINEILSLCSAFVKSYGNCIFEIFLVSQALLKVAPVLNYNAQTSLTSYYSLQLCLIESSSKPASLSKTFFY